MKNYYRILGLSIDAEYEEIKAAYRILAQRYHPDKGGENTEFLLIKEAYDILGNPLTKRNYDKDLFHDLKQPRSIVIRKDTPQSNYFAVSIVVCLTLLALIFSVWAYLKTHQASSTNIKNTSVQIATSTNDAIITPTPIPRKATKPQKKPIKTVSSAPAAKDPFANLTGEHYVLNLGNYSSKSSADGYQATLKTLGYTSFIQRIDPNSEGLGGYSIFMGPYSTNDKANQIQNELESHDINATLEKINFGN